MTSTTSRQAMIDAAERIVAEHGLPAMTLRKVQEAAGQANKNAATYHFGSREGLISAIVEARMGPVDAERRGMLDAIDSGDHPGELRDLVEVLVAPLANQTVRRPGSRYARFLAQTLLDPTLRDIAGHHLRIASFRDARKRAEFAAGGGELARRRMDHVVILTANTLAHFEGTGHDPDEVVGDLIDSATAILADDTYR